MTHPIPAAALRESIAIVGRTGSGKSYAARGAVELLLREGERVCIIDPTGVWFGLRSSADGNAGGFPVVVFGGDHADVPLLLQGSEGATKLANLLAGKNLPAILDISEFSRSGMVRFMTAFLDALYQANRQPLTLVIDEADIFAPQRPEPDSATLLGRMEQIVRRGRVRGFRPWMITQRPASLNKNVLSQANTLIAMQLTAPQDRDAIGAWIEGQADRDEGKRVLAELPKLKKGEGWIWSPSHDVLRRTSFPAITTYDSGRTPEAGEGEAHIALAEVDLSDIRKAFAAVATKPEDKDDVASAEVGELRARVAELETQIDDQRTKHAAKLESIRRSFAALLHELAAESADHAEITRDPIQPTPATLPVKHPAQLNAPRSVAKSNGADNKLPRAECAILAAAAQRHPKPSNRAQLSLLSGYSITSSSFANALGALRNAGCIEGRGDENRITPLGLKTLGPFDVMPTGRSLVNWWAGRLGRAEATLLTVAAKHYPRAVTKETLSAESGYSITSSSFANALGRLRTLELVHGRGEIKASENLF